jgi:hypothetical protein
MNNNDNMFRKLTKQEAEEFKSWARKNYQPGTPISRVWHPVVRQECEVMNEEARENGAKF